MEKLLKNYYLLQARWLPQEPVPTFKPFVIDLIRSEKIRKGTIDELSKNYEHKYGYRLQMFILRPILYYLKNEGYAELSKNEWLFDIDKMPNNNLDEKANNFTSEYNSFINGFVTFADCPDEINFQLAEKILLEFIEENNINPNLYCGRGSFNDEKDAHRYFLSEYIKKLKEEQSPLFQFLIALCESALIKSYMFNEGLKSGAFCDKILFIDTPIIFRLLGYYGEYFQQEYAFLFECLRKQNCQIYIFERNYCEVLSVLKAAERHVDSVNFDISLASEVCNNFRRQGKTAHDVACEIELLETNLKKYEILRFNKDIDWNEKKYIESHEQIKSAIENEYNNADKSKIISLPENAIDIDTKSAIQIYSIRKNNRSQVLKDVKYFYISSNISFVTAIRKFNSYSYHNTISPVVSDVFVGMIVSGENQQNALRIATNKVLSFCYGAFRPTIPMREKFIRLLEKEKEDQKISETDYIAIKNHNLVSDYLVKSTSNSIEELSPNTVYEIREMVKANYVEDVKQTYDIKFDEQEKNYLRELSNVKQQAHEEKEELRNEKKKLRVLIANKDYKQSKRRIKSIYYSILIIIIALMCFGIVSSLAFPDITTPAKIAIFIISGMGVLCSLIWTILSLVKEGKEKILTYFLLKQRTKFANEQDISEEEIKL